MLRRKYYTIINIYQDSNTLHLFSFFSRSPRFVKIEKNMFFFQYLTEPSI